MVGVIYLIVYNFFNFVYLFIYFFLPPIALYCFLCSAYISKILPNLSSFLSISKFLFFQICDSPWQRNVTFNVADVDSIQIIHIEATLTKCKMWIICGLCGFAHFWWYGLNADYADSLILWKQYVDYMWLLGILTCCYFQNKLLIWL